MPILKRWTILPGMMLAAALLGLTAGCRSDAYYQDRAVQRARAYLLEHATELSAEQLKSLPIPAKTPPSVQDVTTPTVLPRIYPPLEP